MRRGSHSASPSSTLPIPYRAKSPMASKMSSSKLALPEEQTNVGRCGKQRGSQLIRAGRGPASMARTFPRRLCRLRAPCLVRAKVIRSGLAGAGATEPTAPTIAS